jgi:eukaryotic-like serine/threonine-protein kinase
MVRAMGRDVPLELGSLIAGKYRLDGVLGRGGMGVVFQATNTAIGRKVAIKVLVPDVANREDVKRRFELEARAAAVIGHPGIVDVLDMGETEDGEPFIVMELLEGASLRTLLRTLGTMSAAQATAVIAPLLDALAAAHRVGVIHRDVKPANIFVCVRPQKAIKLLDFGVSRFGESTGLTATGTAVGTPKYMSPEQVLGEKDVGPAADLYSVGAVMYHLLAGRPPHEADSDMAALARTLTEEHQPLAELRPELSKALCADIDKLLARDPQARPHEAAEVRARLLSLVPREDSLALYAAAASAAAETKATPAPTPRRLASGPSLRSAPGSQPHGRPRGDAPSVTRAGSTSFPALAAVIVIALCTGAAAAFWLHKRTPPPPGAVPPSAVLEEARFIASPRVQAIGEPETMTPAAAVDAGRPHPRRRPAGLDIQERNPYQ